jgi:sulfatase modifying factor 1
MHLKGLFAGFLLSAAALPVLCSAQHRVKAYNHKSIPAPDGMVYVPGGSIVIKYANESDSFNIKKFSLSPYFMDKTEVTNKEYREFVNWVIDSVAVVEYLKDGRYFRDANRDSSHKYINWSKVSHKSVFGKGSDRQAQLQSMYENGEIKTSLYNFAFKSLKATGPNKDNKEFVVESVNIYPDTRVWATDFPNSQADLMVQEYFTNPAYDDYPVVGVTWMQARAFAYWRTLTSGKLSRFLSDYKLPYTLPTEAQWVNAAEGLQGGGTADAPDTINTLLRDPKSKYAANFKQEEGNYTEDGSSYTVPVMAYRANNLGLYNMLGNVAEWVLDAYNVSAWAFVHDQNPVLLYDSEPGEADIMRSKVVRGGSWKDNAETVNANFRNYEVQDVPHSYIGFRLVMPAPEIITEQLETRKSRKK